MKLLIFSTAAEMNISAVSSSSSSEFSLSSIPDANAPLARPESFTLSSSGMSYLAILTWLVSQNGWSDCVDLLHRLARLCGSAPSYVCET